MQQCVVEDKQLVVAPVVRLVAYRDVGGLIPYVVDVVQKPEGRAQPSEMR